MKNKQEKILVISPHADDETLGAGGTLLKYKDEGESIFWLNITDIKKEYGYEEEQERVRAKELESVKKKYGFSATYNLGLEPAGLDKYPKSHLIEEISKIVNEIQPNTVILPYGKDVHTDHKLVFECAYPCTKSFRYPFVKKVLAMEIISETDFAIAEEGFVPNYFVDITNFVDKKNEIMLMYESELGTPPFPRSVENITSLARVRGSTAGVEYAEAFKLLKWVD